MLTFVKTSLKAAGARRNDRRLQGVPGSRPLLPLRWTLSMLLGLALYGCDAAINHFAFYPDTVNVLPAERLPDGIEAFSVTAADGIRSESLYLPYPGAERVLIYFHGNAGNIYHRIPGLLKLQQAGISVVGVSYRGYGRSAGSPSEQGIYRDGEAVFEYVTGELGYAENRVIVLGRSIGSAVAVNVAQGRALHAVILVTPLTTGKAAADAGGLGFMSALAGNSFDNLNKIPKIKAPLMVVHGTGDRIIPYAMGEQLFAAARTEKRLISIEGAGHNNLQGAYARRYWPPIIDFIGQLETR